MSKKRINGEGSISKFIVNGEFRGWRSSFTTGRDPLTGKLIRKQFYAKTEKEALEKLNDFKIAFYTNKLSSDTKITLSEWFADWLFNYKINELSPKSLEKYEGIYRNYIKFSELGRIKLKDLRASHIQSYYMKLMSDGYNPKPPSTIHTINRYLKTCLQSALIHEYITKNYCTLVILPKLQKDTKYVFLTKEQQDLFLKSIENHNLNTLFTTALGTGMRLGELRGLKWIDIDFNNRTINISRTLQRVTEVDALGRKESKQVICPTKTKNSIREIPIPNSVLIKLKKLKHNQNLNKLKFGDIYQDDNFVFCNDIGIPIDDKKPGRDLKNILKHLDINPIKFHGLRHTFATRLFELDIHPKAVQELMGHSNINVTMDIYTHVTKNVSHAASLDI